MKEVVAVIRKTNNAYQQLYHQNYYYHQRYHHHYSNTYHYHHQIDHSHTQYLTITIKGRFKWLLIATAARNAILSIHV